MSTINVNQIRLDGGTQSRESLDLETIKAYAIDMVDGAAFPPVVVFYDGTDYWLADGFHRVKACAFAERAEIDTDVRQGTQRDAILYSVGANNSHGLRRTNADKRRAVMTLLNDEKWAKWSDREISKKCGVSDRFVNGLRPDSSANGSQMERLATRNGTTYSLSTANIGKASKSVAVIEYPAEPEDDDGEDFDPPPTGAMPHLNEEPAIESPAPTPAPVRGTKPTPKPVELPAWQRYPDLSKCVTELEQMSSRPGYQLSVIELKRITNNLKAALQKVL